MKSLLLASSLVVALLAVTVVSSCSRKAAPPTTASTPPPDPVEPQARPPEPAPAAARTESAEVKQTVAEARKLAGAGSYDQAAARLLKMQLEGTRFSDKDAAAYRDALQDAYSQALEAAAKGDPKGKAALDMIRAARGR